MATLLERRTSGLDTATRDAVLQRHLGLVYHVAQQLARSRSNDVEMDDLVSAGTLGLIEAYENFDASRGLAFSTFAAPRISSVFACNPHAPAVACSRLRLL